MNNKKMNAIKIIRQSNNDLEPIMDKTDVKMYSNLLDSM